MENILFNIDLHEMSIYIYFELTYSKNYFVCEL